MGAMSRVAMYRSAQHATDELVNQHAPLVKRIAYHLMGRMPSSVQVDDLIQAGVIGLLEAARNYDASKGASFETYAGIRIRGAMIDEIRRGDWAPRSVHRNARKVASAIRSIEARTHREASDSEVAAELGITLDDYHRMTQDCLGARLFSIDEIVSPDEQLHEDPEAIPTGPHDDVQRGEWERTLASAIDSLPERERLVLALYYNEELNLKEIGLVLGVSESRVSQIHSQAALRLRSRLAEWR